MASGVYAFRHISGAVYVGSSEEISKRRYWHRVMLRSNSHHCVRLQELFNRDGEQAFTFEILEECSTKELREKEQIWADKQTDLIGQSCKGWKHTDATIKKQREARRAYLMTPGAREALAERAKLQHASGKLGRATWSDETRKTAEAKQAAALRARCTKLSDENLAAIRASKESRSVIAERYGIREGTVSAIRLKKDAYAHR